MIPDRTFFLTNFTQRFKSEPFGVDVLRNNKNWEIFVPNEFIFPKGYIFAPIISCADLFHLYILLTSGLH